MAELKWSLVGTVIHYYTKLSVAIIELTDRLFVGDQISIEGFTTDLMQTVDSMQKDHKNVEKAVKGDVIGLKVEGRCRKGDKVKRGDGTKYFVKNKMIHEYPLPSRCKVGYDLQTVYEHPPFGYERCEDCYPKS